jgi:hypothetical protein
MAAENRLWAQKRAPTTKGEFMLADRRYCYPLTITDAASRYVFACEALSTIRTDNDAAFVLGMAIHNEAIAKQHTPRSLLETGDRLLAQQKSAHWPWGGRTV